jgi:hypothetical protein
MTAGHLQAIAVIFCMSIAVNGKLNVLHAQISTGILKAGLSITQKEIFGKRKLFLLD